MERVYNFSAGPGVLPESVLQSAKDDLLNYKGSGMSVMEMTHRGKTYSEIFAQTKASLKEIMSVPDTHEILFLQGGATLQFASIPMNLMTDAGADYAVTGNFSNKAAIEAGKYGKVNIAYSCKETGFDRIPKQNELKLNDDASYFYYCSNNTIYGTEWQYRPEVKSKLVCDMSSDILTSEVDVSKYSLIYAGAQKNMAPAGLTVVIVDKSIVGKEMAITPQVMSYKVMVDNDSMLNTPPCWCIYMLSLMLDWVKSEGGVKGMEERKIARAGKVYDVLDNSTFYVPHAQRDSRSYMNVTFKTPSEELDAEFVKGAADKGLVSLKGHRITGGIRASLYNAMPMEGVDKLVSYMKEFEASHV